MTQHKNTSHLLTTPHGCEVKASKINLTSCEYQLKLILTFENTDKLVALFYFW